MRFLYTDDQHKKFLEIYKLGRPRGAKMFDSLGSRDQRDFFVWEDTYEHIFECPRCGNWRDRFVYAAHTDFALVPSAVDGFYCPDCAVSVEEEYKRICSLCGYRFREIHAEANHQLCPTCRIGSLSIEEKRVRYHIHRAKKAGVPATLTLSEWLETLDHFDWKCAYCRGDYYLLEHFVSISSGGGTTADNCVPGCVPCNVIKTDKNITRIPENDWERVKSYLSLR